MKTVHDPHFPSSQLEHTEQRKQVAGPSMARLHQASRAQAMVRPKGRHAIGSSHHAVILDDVIGALRRGRSPILLTGRKDHVEFFANALKPIARHVIVLQGGMGVREHREVHERLGAIPDIEERVLVATGRYIGEGFDDPRLDTLFLAMPVSWKGTLVQYTGRLHRLHPGKTEVQLFDYVDCEVPMLLSMFEKRLRGYRAIGYARGEAPLGFAEPRDDLVIEYDEETIANLENVDEFT